jgi:hypothetical protein
LLEWHDAAVLRRASRAKGEPNLLVTGDVGCTGSNSSNTVLRLCMRLRVMIFRRLFCSRKSIAVRLQLSSGNYNGRDSPKVVVERIRKDSDDHERDWFGAVTSTRLLGRTLGAAIKHQVCPSNIIDRRLEPFGCRYVSASALLEHTSSAMRSRIRHFDRPRNKAFCADRESWTEVEQPGAASSSRQLSGTGWCLGLRASALTLSPVQAKPDRATRMRASA